MYVLWAKVLFCMRCPRIVAYNVFSARRAYRPRDVKRRDRRTHHWFNRKATSFSSSLGWLVRWVCAQTHIAAGVSIVASKRSWKPRHVVRTFDVLPRLQGRAVAIRLRSWQEDVTAIVMCLPPKPKPLQRHCTVSLAKWLGKTLQDSPRRSTPYIMTDDENQA